MASPYRLVLSESDRGFVKTKQPLQPESACTTSALLMRNHEQHHIYFDNAGLHSKLHRDRRSDKEISSEGGMLVLSMSLT